MRKPEDIESFLIESGYQFEHLSDQMWRVSDEADDLDNILVFATGNVLNFQVGLFTLPESPSVALLHRMLELNATSLIYGAFAIDKDKVILIGALEMDNLDRNELQAMIESMAMAIREHHEELTALIS